MFSAKTPPLIYTKFGPSLHRICLGVAAVLAIMIAQQSLTVSNAQGSIAYLDKVAHFLAYGALGIFALPALPRSAPIIVIIGLGLFGGFLEIGQGVMDLGRTADFFDAVSNLAGAFMALVFWQTVSKFRA